MVDFKITELILSIYAKFIALVVFCFLTACVSDDNGATGEGESETLKFVDATAGLEWSMLLDDKGGLWFSGTPNSVSPDSIPNGDKDAIRRYKRIMSDISQVATGFRSASILKNDKSLWISGESYCLTTNTRIDEPNWVADDVIFVADGPILEGFFITSDGTLRACSRDDGIIEVMPDVKFATAARGYIFLIKNDNSLWGLPFYEGHRIVDRRYSVWLNDFLNADNVKPKRLLDNIKSVASGVNYAIALGIDGDIHAIGANNSGQLGLGSTTDWVNEFTFVTDDIATVACGFYHSLIIKNDGSLWSSGNNYYGQLGTGEIGEFVELINEESLSTTDKSNFVKIASNITNIAGGTSYSIFIKHDGSVWGMGENTNGNLGLADGNLPRKIFNPHKIIVESPEVNNKQE